MRALVFPALFRPMARGDAGEKLMVDGEASCFYHPQKKAAVPCDRCGRFLCGLCDVELNNEHICPACLESGKQNGKLQTLANRRVLYDDIACALAVWPLFPFFWFFTFLTAPAALFIAIRFYKAPPSLVPRSKARMITAMIVSGLQILGWLVILTLILIRFTKH